MSKIRMETSQGVIVAELDAENAPVTVQNILTYVKDGYYDGTIFHRVIDGFMIQGGGFDENMEEKETLAPIKNEAGNGLKNVKGTLAMARTSFSLHTSWPHVDGIVRDEESIAQVQVPVNLFA